MLIQIILFIFLGIFSGTISGLIPGIHINLVAVFLVSLSTNLFYSTNPIYFVIFITALAITHTFLDFVPSIFLGAPDSDTELSVLPGHEMLKNGNGYQAVYLSVVGGLIGIFLLLIFSFPMTLLVPKIYSLIKNLVPYILALTCLLTIFSGKNKFKSFFVFLLAGILGWCVLNLDVKEPLLPMLTGLFGASTLIQSIKSKTKIPLQNFNEKIRTKIFKPALASFLISPLSIFLPALGSGQLAIIANQISKSEKAEFLLLQGCINVLAMGFSFLALYTISKTRTGATVAIRELVNIPTTKTFFLILFVIFISGICAFFLSLFFAKIFARTIEKINYSKLSVCTLIFLTILVFIFSGISGILILIISTFTGIYSIQLNVKRTNLMGCLLIPTIILYLS